MDLSAVFDLGAVREGVLLTALFSGIPLLACLVVGFVIAVLQAATQIQEQTLTFVPKLVVIVVLIAVGGPWMADHLVRYLSSVLLALPQLGRIAGGG